MNVISIRFDLYLFSPDLHLINIYEWKGFTIIDFGI